jgi:hypothetical protein
MLDMALLRSGKCFVLLGEKIANSHVAALEWTFAAQKFSKTRGVCGRILGD